MRKGLENLCLTSEAFLNIRTWFVKSYAVFSVAAYILGIGDRHMENFLLDKNDGEILGIDFGIAFDSGIGLQVPELSPIRITRQIQGVVSPLSINGSFWETMIYTLTALWKHKNIILDTCEVFVKD